MGSFHLFLSSFILAGCSIPFRHLSSLSSPIPCVCVTALTRPDGIRTRRVIPPLSLSTFILFAHFCCDAVAHPFSFLHTKKNVDKMREGPGKVRVLEEEFPTPCFHPTVETLGCQSKLMFSN